MRLFVVCLLLGCTLMACAEIIPCGSDALIPQEETIVTRLEPGRVMTDILLTFPKQPVNHPVTLALPFDTPPRVLQVESIDEITFDEEYTGEAMKKLRLQPALDEKPPSRNALESFLLVGSGPLYSIYPFFCKAREKARACQHIGPYTLLISTRTLPIDTRNLRAAQFLDHPRKLALIQHGVLPPDCAHKSVALFSLTPKSYDSVNLHLHLEQAASTETGRTAIFPHGVTTHWWKDIPLSGGFVDCPNNYQLQIYKPIRNLIDNYWMLNGEGYRIVPATSGIPYQKVYSTPVLSLDGTLGNEIAFSLIPDKQHCILTAVAVWMLDSQHTLFIAILAFLATWGLSSVKIIKPAWQATGQQGFPLKVSLACIGMAFLWPFIILALFLLPLICIMLPHVGNYTTIDIIFIVVICAIDAAIIGVLFLVARAFHRYYRRIFDTNRYFWQAWALAMSIYILLGTGCWALAIYAEHMATG